MSARTRHLFSALLNQIIRPLFLAASAQPAARTLSRDNQSGTIGQSGPHEEFEMRECALKFGVNAMFCASVRAVAQFVAGVSGPFARPGALSPN